MREVRRDDWYRRTTWTEEDREAFEGRLRRARRANRPGYLRVQGSVLAGSEDPELRGVGRELLARAIDEDDSDWPLEAQWARAELARAFARDGQLAEAERWYRACAKCQEDHGGYGVNTDCHVGLAEVLLRRAPEDAGVAEEAGRRPGQGSGPEPAALSR